MSIHIETGIPMPAKPVIGGKYPFYTMEVGESFVVGLEGRSSWAYLYSAISKVQDKTTRKFTTRLLDNGNRRVWRSA